MLFVVDPAEKFRGTTTNDGGARFVRSCPLTPEQTTSNPLFANGTVLSSSVGPHAQRPFFSHFAVDLKSAYSDKIRSYVRSFCFLNLDNEQTPAVLIVLDALTTAKPEFEKRWQINALNPPERTAEGVVLHQSALGLTGKVNIRMLRPRPTDRELEILSGKMANSVAGTVFEAPKPNAPEGKGHRVVFSAKTARAQETFLTVLTMADEDAPELPVAVAETPNAFVLSLANRVVVMPRNEKLLGEPLTVEVPPGQGWQLLLAGLAPGAWSIQSADGKTIVIEAESYTRRVAGAGAGRGIEWKLQDKPGCSGKGLMAALPDKGTGVDAGYESQCPRLDYLVNFPAKGKYTVWMRSWGANPNGDSIFLGMDLKGSDKSLFHIGNGKLQWQKHHHDHAFDVTEPGMHTIHVWMREDGSAFDKLVITLDRGMITPEGNGPAESRQQ